MCQRIREVFARRGIAPERIELHGASFHADLLEEYADVDIALDPFSFTGSLTSCEALWMGVPVVTWPQSRVVSRQTFAFLGAIGTPELAANDADDYVRSAVELASDSRRLEELRATLREWMHHSSMRCHGLYAHPRRCIGGVGRSTRVIRLKRGRKPDFFHLRGRLPSDG
jgi:protein O-GlcNAc transferase